MSAYYNEHDKHACAWLRELIKKNLIAPGQVDERDIRDVRPNELIQFRQIHLFAGIGVWSYALRQAGWEDDRPVLTGSCPCQPFSAAGKKEGTNDKRHLWPEMFRLIAGLPESQRPPTIFGEQVAQQTGQAWFDDVQTDLARENYAAGLVVFPACGLGAPHLRQRLYWFADSVEHTRCNGRKPGARHYNVRRERHSPQPADQPDDRHEVRHVTGDTEPVDGVADSDIERQKAVTENYDRQTKMDKSERSATNTTHHVGCSDTDGVANRNGKRSQRHRKKSEQQQHAQGRQITSGHSAESCDTDGAGPTNGYWRDADWLWCRDHKWRPVEPSLEPLVDGAAARMVRLSGYGNAIVAPQAQAFIEAYLNK